MFRVDDSYANQCVLLTGSTGFLGKVIMEKLLWSVPSLKKVFLLIRPQRGVQPAERLKKLLTDPLFNRVRIEKPETLEKLQILEGDILHENLGLNQNDLQKLFDEATIVVHSAATVKFDEELKMSVNMNVLGTRRLLEISKKMKGLKVFVHISTAYANCHLPDIEEKIYDAPMDPQQLIDTLQWMDINMAKLITPELIKPRPNTYTFTKALAEGSIKTQKLDDGSPMPILVIRPSIVGAMWKDPLPGWTDNINGATGVFAAVGKGLLTNMCGSESSKADIIPVDIVANMIIVSAAHYIYKRPAEIPVMHCTSGHLNPLYWRKIVVFLGEFFKKYPMKDTTFIPSTWFHDSKALFLLNYYVKHYIPAWLMDKISMRSGKRHSYVRMYDKIRKMADVLHFFTTHGWMFRTDALVRLLAEMNEEDKENFDFDVRRMDWDSYLYDYVMGIKRFLLKDKLSDLPAARSHLAKLQLIRFASTSAFWYFIVQRYGQKWTKNSRVLTWLAAMTGTHLYLDVNFREKCNFKSVEEYKATAYRYAYLKESEI